MTQLLLRFGVFFRHTAKYGEFLSTIALFMILFRDRPAKFPPSPLCCLIFPPLFLAKVQALASFCSDFLHPALSQIGALGAFMLLRLQADREMFGNVSAPRPSLNEAPVAEGTIRCSTTNAARCFYILLFIALSSS